MPLRPLTPRQRLSLAKLLLAVAWCWSLAVLCVGQVQAAEREGFQFPEPAKVAGKDLLLNGTGIRSVGPFKGYVVGLYLQRQGDTTQAVLSQAGPKRLRLGMLMGAPANELAKAVDKGISKNLSKPEQLAAMRPRLDQFLVQIRAARSVVKGDVVELDFDPARGLIFTLNGKSFGEPIAGADLYNALLLSFIGEHPYQADMRQGLLSGAR